jgi:hypothetical protein
MKHRTLSNACVVAALTLWTCFFARAEGASGEARAAQVDPSWHSPSLTDETATAPNGAITTRIVSAVAELASRGGAVDPQSA